MIGHARPPEPPRLAALRARRLIAARVAVAAGDDIDFRGYNDLEYRQVLFDAQRRKCAYCDKTEEQPKYRDTEHYRPKVAYWWLAWTWENLLFACNECNRDHKKTRFPLAAGSVSLVAEQPPPGQEVPLVIDPFALPAGPCAEIEFRRERVQRHERWRPYGLTERARTTIDVCGLDRPSLLTLYEDHVNGFVRPKLERFLADSEAGDTRSVVTSWSTLTRGLLAAYQPFHALSRDAVFTLVNPELRARYGLTL